MGMGWRFGLVLSWFLAAALPIALLIARHPPYCIHPSPPPRWKINPGSLERALVSCTGAQFCGLALSETKMKALEVTKMLEAELDIPKPVRIHFTGCPNSCGQAQVGQLIWLGLAREYALLGYIILLLSGSGGCQGRAVVLRGLTCFFVYLG